MPVEFKDYYQVLGVQPKATDEDIKKAFRNLARKYHPDVAKDKKTAEDKFKELNEAHEVLSNPESHKKYDQLGANWKTGAESRPPPGRARGQSAGRGAMGEDYDFQFEGTVSLKVPAGTQQGHQLRIRGKGLPAGANRRGDLYVTVFIQVPPRISKVAESLWKQLAAESAFDPRKTS